MTYRFSKTSLDNLVGVHPKLVEIVHRTLEAGVMDFRVVEGLRSVETQKSYVAKGVSKTMNSKHLKQADSYSHAVDLYPYPIDMKAVNAGRVQEIAKFGVLAGVLLKIAKEEGVNITWGGHWKSFFDAPHFQIEI